MNRQLYNKAINIDGVNIFYREAGDSKKPSLLLLHGFPTSSLMFKSLMIALSDKFHLIAPDYPAFGFSDVPSAKDFEYSFENIALYMDKFTEAVGLQSFTVYVHDYGSYIGARICLKNPEKIEAIIVQNGNNYLEGHGPNWEETKEYWKNPTDEAKEKVYAFLSKEGTKEQYFAGVPEELHQNISPESWIIDWERLSRPGNLDIQYTLNLTYPTNFELFPDFQKYLRKHQPPTLIIWGKHDVYFDVAEAYCYKRDLSNVQTHILDGGHMALETNFEEVLNLIEKFMDRP
ncbi:alpha/beta hydrolase [Sphingobacterium sp. SGG-5]|uniref:alpha/beta fold hydrolase n=1 Tax=Sphingobacterium sp. SGG-5 TaxID=2710881 RepID=UPI0013EB7D5C|nr:alpha/beta hydrolase [Sphingobacterium sp. SGG-5]NGM63490.1 alpha/beta hydrolase [Sphingobacterium sp. SGG-5]